MESHISELIGWTNSQVENGLRLWDPTCSPPWLDMGGCPNYCPFLGTRNIRCRIIIDRDPRRDHNFDNHPYWGGLYIGIMAKKMETTIL